MGYFGQIVIAPPTPPAGANGQVQFNDGGAFGADAGLAFDKASKALAVGGNVKAAGMLVAARKTVPADAELANGEVAVWYDEASHRVGFRAKDNTGDVWKGQIGLSHA